MVEEGHIIPLAILCLYIEPDPVSLAIGERRDEPHPDKFEKFLKL